MIRIRILGLEAELDDQRAWHVTRPDSKRALSRTVERLLNRSYGFEWEPEFGVYEPSHGNASAQAVVIDMGAEVLELDPSAELPRGVAV